MKCFSFVQAGIRRQRELCLPGLGITGLSRDTSWGFYIANFTFLVGVAAAAVMIILPSYIFKDKDLHKVVIVGEVVAIGALVMCLMFVFVDLGGPLERLAHDTDYRSVQLADVAADLGRTGIERLFGLEPAGAGLHPVLSLLPPQAQ